MKGLIAALVGVGLVLSAPVQAQSNNDDYTPLGSRIKRNRQFPLDLPIRFDRDQLSKVNRNRNQAILNQFNKCIYNRSKEGALDLLQKTDFGFVNFEQIGLDTGRAVKIYGFHDCLTRVASANRTDVQLRFSPGSLRQWLLQEAYFVRYPDGPEWVKPGNVIDERSYPLSANNPGVHVAMDLADCVVAADPYDADFFYRAQSGSDDEKKAIEALTPALGPCIPEGQQVGLSPYTLRVWTGEALWHAANNSAPAPAGGSQ